MIREFVWEISDHPWILFQFQEQEKKRYTQEQQRFETKHAKQLEESRASADSTVRYVEVFRIV